MTAYVIIKDCPQCHRRTPHGRHQRSVKESGQIIIRTTYECDVCGAQQTNDEVYEAR